MDGRRCATSVRAAACGAAAALVLASWAGQAPAEPAAGAVPAAPIQLAGVAGDFNPYTPLYADAPPRRPAPKEAPEVDDDVGPARAEARASAAAQAAEPSEAGVSTLGLWLAGLGAMLFVAWRLKGD